MALTPLSSTVCVQHAELGYYGLRQPVQLFRVK